MSFAVTLNRIPALMAAMEAKAEAAVAKVAHDIQADAQQRAPIDTGNLRGSGYSRPAGRLTWEVGFTAEYALYVELGTRRMRAQPYLIPAWVAGRYRLVQAIRRMGLL